MATSEIKGTSKPRRTVRKRTQINDIAKEDHILLRHWRSMLAYTYILINITDFVIMPVLFNFLQYLNPGDSIGSYHAYTLEMGGMFHISMGAVLGVSAAGKSKLDLAKLGK